MNFVMDNINQWMKDMLSGIVLNNLTNAFSLVNEKAGTIAAEVGESPATWKGGSIYSMLRAVSENAVLPVAVMILTAILVYDLLQMVGEKNNFHEMDTDMLVKWILKACFGVYFLNHTFDFILAIFDVGGFMVQKLGVTASSINMDMGVFGTQIAAMSIGELFGAMISSYLLKIGMNVLGIMIVIILYSRMIEIFFYLSIGPLPFATFMNREWGNIGTNYIRILAALAVQGFFMLIAVAVYSGLLSGLSTAGSLDDAIWNSLAITAVLCIMLWKTNSIAKSVFHAM